MAGRGKGTGKRRSGNAQGPSGAAGEGAGGQSAGVGAGSASGGGAEANAVGVMPVVQTRPIGSIRPYENNPRRNDKAVAAVATSIREFGWTQPIVVDADGVIIIGHTRYRAALSLGQTHVPVATVTHLSAERVRALRIADNKVGELATWDETRLAEELKLTNVDWTTMGFKAGEYIKAVGLNEGATEQDDVPSPEKLAVSRMGDLWELGDHRLLCGNSQVREDVAKVMAGDVAAMCVTDPPYAVKYTGKRPSGGGKDWSGVYNEVNIEPAEFYLAMMQRIIEVSRDAAPLYVWHADRCIHELTAVWRKLDLVQHEIIVWTKPRPMFGHLMWQYRHEPCLMGWKRGYKPQDCQFGYGTTVWDDIHAGVKLEEMTREQLLALCVEQSSVWELEYEQTGMLGNEHPTQKPVECFARPIRKHTQRGDVLFEPFSGSGTQIVAAEQMGRRCRAVELSPVFVDVGVRRWQRLTGKAATLAGDGRTWEQVKAARAGGGE